MMARAIERFLFASRWLLAPFFVLLVGGVFALLVKASQHSWIFATHLLTSSEPSVIVDVLGFVDLTLAALLIVTVILAGYESFIARFDLPEDDRRPNWLGHVDFRGLKLRLMSTIVAITAIQLLRVFINVDETSTRDLAWYVGIHLTFVVSAFFLALTDRVAPGGREPPKRD